MQKIDRSIIRNPSHLNMHFKTFGGSYAEVFGCMIADRTVSTRGLQPDAKVIDELVLM